MIDFFRKRKEEKTFRVYWLVSALVILALYFVFPDWMGSGGFISFRWLLFFFLLMIILIAAKALPVKQLLIPVIAILVTHSFFVKYHYGQTKALSDDAATLAEAEKYIESNKVLLPLNYSSNWIQMSHAGYMAATKNIICLDNYEPCKPHFPLIWKEGENVFDLMKYYGNRNPPCININAYEQKTKHRIDYLSRFYFNGDVTDSCTILVEKEIQQKFELIYKSENNKLELFKRKQGT